MFSLLVSFLPPFCWAPGELQRDQQRGQRLHLVHRDENHLHDDGGSDQRQRCLLQAVGPGRAVGRLKKSFRILMDVDDCRII